MVNIDTVYQTVLALANKEQRGYITPQEFNLFAEQSQLEIIEQYFYDMNQFDRIPGNSLEYSNMVDLINQKLAGLKVLDFSVNVSGTPSTYVVPDAVYKLGSVYTNNTLAQQVSRAESRALQASPLTTPTMNTPVYNLSAGNNDDTKIILLYPVSTSAISIDYIKLPAPPRWGFTIVGERAMWNPTRTQHFELHTSEVSELVYRILMLAGITINKQEISSAATALQGSKTQQEKQ